MSRNHAARVAEQYACRLFETIFFVLNGEVRRNPRRSYLRDLPELYPDEFPENYDPANHSDEQNTRMAYNAYLRKFLRCVKRIDDSVGRLFAYLEESGQLDNTLIIYTGTFVQVATGNGRATQRVIARLHATGPARIRPSA